ncbi:hypothetical protein CONPUDRAFT_83245, partial [Coniophora puteana RWD-64-598 SS2]
MHRALEITEILELIVNNVQTTKALMNLAQTSKSFKEPAINGIYSSLAFWFEIIKCLPHDLRKFQQDKQPKGAFRGNRQPQFTISLKRKMKECDWDLLRSHAAKVRAIGFREPEQHRYHRQSLELEGWDSYTSHPPSSV